MNDARVFKLAGKVGVGLGFINFSCYMTAGDRLLKLVKRRAPRQCTSQNMFGKHREMEVLRH